jgi:hypothetical protein
MIARPHHIALALVDMIADDCRNGNLRALLTERLAGQTVRQADVDEAARRMAVATLAAFGVAAHTVPVFDPDDGAWTVAPLDDDRPDECPRGWDEIDTSTDDDPTPSDEDLTSFYL